MLLKINDKTNRWLGETLEELSRKTRHRRDAELLRVSGIRLQAASYDPIAVKKLLGKVYGASPRAKADAARKWQAAVATVGVILFTLAVMAGVMWSAKRTGDAVAGHVPTAAEVNATTGQGR